MAHILPVGPTCMSRQYHDELSAEPRRFCRVSREAVVGVVWELLDVGR
jgi:hypothetical protein